MLCNLAHTQSFVKLSSYTYHCPQYDDTHAKLVSHVNKHLSMHGNSPGELRTKITPWDIAPLFVQQKSPVRWLTHLPSTLVLQVMPFPMVWKTQPLASVCCRPPASKSLKGSDWLCTVSPHVTWPTSLRTPCLRETHQTCLALIDELFVGNCRC